MNFPQLEKAIDTIEKLRHPTDGCPWDLEQTHESLLPYLIEEAYEFIEAVESGDYQEMKNELGDVLLQVLLHSKIASENSHFNLEDIAQELTEKMIRRHPHVFASDSQNNKIDAKEVTENWNKIKEQEKAQSKSTGSEYAIGKEALKRPALSASNYIGKKTRQLNFDWHEVNQVLYKVEEEWQELKEEMTRSVLNKDAIEEELGDFLFTIAQLSRHLDFDPEQTLRKANLKFIKRFNKVEDLLREKGHAFKDLKQEELDQYWNRVKQQ